MLRLAPARRALAVLLGVAVLVGVAVAAVVVIRGVRSAERDGPGTRTVRLTVDGQPPVQGWSYAVGTAELVSTRERTTYLDVALRRDVAPASRPVLRSDFDGSGGGEAQTVRCAIPSAAAWRVGIGRTQHFRLPCSRFVPQWQLSSVASVFIGDDLG